MELINQIDETLNFNEKTIRIIGTCNDPWFVAKDICNILELSNITEALKHIPNNWRGSFQMNTFGGMQEMITINEPGLYKLIMRSRKPIAQPFQEHVCEIILPALRKQGEYKIQTILNEKIKQLEEEKNKEINEISKENKELSRKVLRKKLSNSKKGNVIYIVTNELMIGHFKVGITLDMNARLSGLNTGAPTQFTLEEIWYTRFNKEIEDAVKKNFINFKVCEGNEWYEIVSYNKIVDYIEKLVLVFNETDLFIPEPKIESITEEIIEIVELPPNLIIVDNNRTEKKKCTKCLYALPLHNFYLRNDNVNSEDFNLEDDDENEKYKDQKYRSHCKKCYNESTKDLRLKIKSDSNNLRKECIDCNILLPFELFYKDTNEDLYNNCIECYNKNSELTNVKQCKECKFVLPTDKFSKHTGVLLRAQCKDCRNKANQANAITIKCEFCEAEIKHKSNLAAHQKTKACLAKQNNTPLDKIEKRKTPLVNARSKIVIQFSIADGSIIKEYNSIAEAAKETKIGRTNIEKCCNKIHKTSGGYQWQWGSTSLTLS